MRGIKRLALASVSFASIATVVAAQPAASGSSEDTTLSEVVVTARRKAESLQTVPQTVNAVTGSTLEKLNLRQFEEVQAVVPGLTLTGSTSGYTTAATIRGAPFNAEGGAQPTVAFYLNDASIASVFAFQSMFDVGQIEVLRGPQGTLRGQSAPSGSITLTTRRPSLGEFGGYGNLTVTDQQGQNLNGAVNVPIIRDVLAFRLAGLIDDNRGDDVNSISATVHPSVKTWAARPSLRFEPNDAISVNLMYQRLEKKLISYDQFVSVSELDPTQAAVPPILRAKDYASILDDFASFNQKQDLFTANAEYRFAGQRLTYVGSFSKMDLRQSAAQDFANILTDVDFHQRLHSRSKQSTNELRLSSDQRLFGFFDYVVGAYQLDFDPPTSLTQVSPLTIGGNLVAINETPIERSGKQHERSVFGTATFHIGQATEISGGLRKLWYRSANNLVLDGFPLLDDKKSKAEATLYNISASHQFTSDFMVYANTGSAFRPGPFVIGVFRPLTPTLERHTDLANEKSKSYEVGFKSTFFERRVLLNAAVFHQDFNNFIQRGQPVYYVGLSRLGPTVEKFNFGNSVDAKIDGVDIDASWQVMQGLNLSGAFSYAKSKIKNQPIACTDINGDGRPDLLTQAPTVAELQAATGDQGVSECLSSDPLQYTPKWGLTLQGEYARPVNEEMDGYIRGLFTYRPKTNGDPNNRYDAVDGFGLLNLYGGVRSRDGGWEIALYAKNVLNTVKVLTADPDLATTTIQELQPPTFQTAVASSITAPYVHVTTTAPREVGINLRYAFGSR